MRSTILDRFFAGPDRHVFLAKPLGVVVPKRTDFAGDLSCNSPVEAVASRSWPFSTTTTASAALARPAVAAMSTAPRLPNAGEPTRGFGAAPPPAVRSSFSRGHAIARPAARLAGSGSIAPAGRALELIRRENRDRARSRGGLAYNRASRIWRVSDVHSAALKTNVRDEAGGLVGCVLGVHTGSRPVSKSQGASDARSGRAVRSSPRSAAAAGLRRARGDVRSSAAFWAATPAARKWRPYPLTPPVRRLFSNVVGGCSVARPRCCPRRCHEESARGRCQSMDIGSPISGLASPRARA
jgi:hypothetical protein